MTRISPFPLAALRFVRRQVLSLSTRRMFFGGLNDPSEKLRKEQKKEMEKKRSKATAAARGRLREGEQQRETNRNTNAEIKTKSKKKENQGDVISLIKLFESYNVADDIVDGLIIGKGHRHRTHLHSINILGMSSPETFFKTFELTHHVPILLINQFWRIQSFVAFSFCAMTGLANHVGSLPCRRVPFDFGDRRFGFQSVHIGSHICNGLIVG